MANVWHHISPCGLTCSGSVPRGRNVSLSHREVSPWPAVDQKNGIFVVRFRHGRKQFKKSLRTSDKTDADGALRIWCSPRSTGSRPASSTSRRALIPETSLSLGESLPPASRRQNLHRQRSHHLAALIEKYLAAQFTKAQPSVSTERTHLNNLKSVLGSLADRPCNEITHGHLTTFLQQRREKRADTVKKERMTVRQLFAWACRQGILTKNPAERPAQNQGGRGSEEQVQNNE